MKKLIVVLLLFVSFNSFCSWDWALLLWYLYQAPVGPAQFHPTNFFPCQQPPDQPWPDYYYYPELQYNLWLTGGCDLYVYPMGNPGPEIYFPAGVNCIWNDVKPGFTWSTLSRYIYVWCYRQNLIDDAKLEYEYTNLTPSNPDMFKVRCSIYLEKLVRAPGGPVGEYIWVKNSVASAEAECYDEEVAKCDALFYAEEQFFGGYTTKRDGYISDINVFYCNANGIDRTFTRKSEKPCSECPVGSNSGTPFDSSNNGFSSCMSCSGGSMTLGGHYHANLSARNSTMGYGWRNDFEIGLVKLQGSSSATEYMILKDGSSISFRQHSDGSFSTSEKNQRAQIINVGGVNIVRIRIGDTAYEFDVPSDFGLAGLTPVRKTTTIITETNVGTDANKIFEYSGHDVIFAYDAQNRLEKITSENGEFYTFLYNAGSGLLETVKNTKGENVRTFTYDTDGNLASRWQIGLGTTNFRYTTVKGNNHLLSGIDKPGGVSSDYQYNDIVEVTGVLGQPLVIAKPKSAENAYSGPQTEETFHYVPEGRSYTEYKRPIKDESGSLVYAVSKEYEPEYVNLPEFGDVTKTETLEENGSTTITYTCPYGVLQSQTTGADGSVKTSKYAYEGPGNISKSVTRHAGTITGLPPIAPSGASGGDWDEIKTYDDQNRPISITALNGATRHIEYLAGSTDASSVSAKWDEAGGGKINKTTYEYYPSDAPVHQKFRLWKENKVLSDLPSDPPNPSDISTTTYDYIQSDPDNPQNIGKLAKKTYSDASFEEWTYGCCDVATYRNRLGGVTTYLRDSAGRLLSEIDPSGAKAEYTYDNAGRVLTKKLSSGGIITNTWDAQGRLTRMDYPDGSYETKSYRVDGQIAEERSKTGLLITHSYNDSDAFLLSTSCILDSEFCILTSSSYDSIGRTATVTDARGLILTMSYDSFGNANKILYPDETFTENTFNAKGQLVTSKDRLGNITNYEYDDFGRQTLTANSSQLTATSYSYDALSRPVSLVLTDGTTTLTTSYQYNFEGRPTRITYADNSTESFVYNNGLLTARTGKDGKTWTNTYTAAGQPDQVIAPDNLGVYSDADYNAKGQLSSFTGPDEVRVSYEYDNMGRVIKLVYPDGTFSQTEYGVSGPAAQIDRSGRRTEFTYDALGRQISIQNPKSEVISFEYNLAGDRTALVDSNSNRTEWTYDAEGRNTKKTYADGSFYEYTYNSNGQLVSRTWVTQAFQPVVSSYSYDSMGQLTAIDYANDTDVSFSYDAFGRKTGMSDASGTTNWTYDANGNILTENGPFDNDTVNYEYSLGRKSSMTLTGSSSVSYSYDAASRLSSVSHAVVPAEADSFSYSYFSASNKPAGLSLNGNEIVSNSYDVLGRLTNISSFVGFAALCEYNYQYNDCDQRISVQSIIHPPQRTSSKIDYSYDLAGQLTGAVRKFEDDTQDFSYNYSYNYDPMGNPSQRISQGQIRNYTANNLNQLASASGPNSTDVAGKVAPELVAPFNVSVNGQAAAVDPQGNWIVNVPLTVGENQISVTATDRFNRTASEVRNVTLAPAPTFSYDGNGNMTSDGEWTYTYNDENRMIQQVKANDTKVEYVHDVLGRMRIEKSYSWTGSAWNLTSEKHFIYDGVRIIAELDDSDSLIHSYVWGLDIDGGFGTAGGVGGLLLCDNELACYDGNGNRVAMIDLASGSVSYTCEYDPFGNVINETGTTACPFGFSTQYTSHGLVHYLYRDYAPKYGRWMTRDPIGELGGYNLYRFCSNNPVNNCDCSGCIDKLWLHLLDIYCIPFKWLHPKPYYSMGDEGILKGATTEDTNKYYESFTKNHDEGYHNIDENATGGSEWRVGKGEDNYTSAVGILQGTSTVMVKGKARIKCKEDKKIGNFHVKWTWYDRIDGYGFEQWRKMCGTNPYWAKEPYIHLLLDVLLGCDYDVRIHWNDNKKVEVPR